MIFILTGLINNEIINCYDGTYDKETLKKWSDKKIIKCQVCGKPYKYCHGRVRIPYFKHDIKDSCELKYSEPETNEHLQGKIDLFNWIKNQNGITDAILEGWISSTKQRPDIMFKFNDKQYVIEYQCSPISSEYLERHELYNAAGIKDIWICGYNSYFTSNAVGKYIEKYAYGYYDVKTKRFIYTPFYTNLYKKNSKLFKTTKSYKKNEELFCNYLISLKLNKYGIFPTTFDKYWKW